MKQPASVRNRYLLKYTVYPDVQQSSLRMTDNFTLRLEWVPYEIMNYRCAVLTGGCTGPQPPIVAAALSPCAST